MPKITRSLSPSFEEILTNFLRRPNQKLNDSIVKRRDFIGTLALTGSAIALASCTKRSEEPTPQPDPSYSKLPFEEVEHTIKDTLSVAANYDAPVLIRWGDPIFSHAKEFDPLNQTEESQLNQFGFNNDFVGFLPLPLGSHNSTKGLLAVNHEYTSSRLMVPGLSLIHI